MSETEKTLVQKARELTKLEAKRAEAERAENVRRNEAITKLAAIDNDIATVRGEISALVSPVQEAPKA